MSHEIVLGPSSSNSVGWTFKKNGKTTSVKVESKLRLTVNEGMTAAVVEGMGNRIRLGDRDSGKN